MKSVLISIQPKWVQKIANGEKTIEVRKTAPDAPFKCYIYCTKDKQSAFFTEQVFDGEKGKWAIPHLGNGKVVGEFICDKVDKYTFSYYEAEYRVTHVEQNAMCLNQSELIHYGNGKPLYGLHISDLKIYDKPKELREFFTPMGKRPSYMIERPPQSWQYVEKK